MNDDQVGDDLRAAVEAQSPPPSDALADVMRRGRRRRVRQHLAASAAAVAVLAGAGTAAAMIGSPTAAPPAATPNPAVVDWPVVGPTYVWDWTWSSQVFPPTDGRKIVAVPPCHNAPPVDEPHPADPELLERVRAAAARVAPDAMIGPPLNLGASHLMDVTDRGGPAGLRVHVGTYTGEPVEAAADRAYYDSCAPPKRTIRPDGTVLQLYPLMPGEPYQSLTMTLLIFRPDGTFYSIAAVNYATSDYELGPDGYVRVGPGRETLALTEAQLARIGLTLLDG